MEDGEQISSTTPHVDNLRFSEEWVADTRSEEPPFYHREAEFKEDDDILDLAGGAKEALERHKATMQQDFDSPPVDLFSKPTLPEHGPSATDPILDADFSFGDAGEKRSAPAVETADTSHKPQTPKVEPVSPVKDSPTVSPSSYESIFPPPAPSQPLIPSSAEGRAQPLGKEGDSSQLGSVALVPPLSPLHSPDSLEELSLSESPNQAIVMSSPFSSCAAPATDFSQKSTWDVPLSKEVNMFECVSESKLGLDNDDHSFLSERDKVGVKAANFSPGEVDPFLSSLMTSEVDLGSKVEPVKSGRCEDSGVASSPDEKLGSSGGSHDDGKTDSDKEGFDKDSESGESSGSTPTQSPVNTKVATESFPSYAPSNPSASLDASHFETLEIMKDVDEPSKDELNSKTSWYEADLLSSKAEMDDFLCEVRPSAAAAKNPFQGFSPIADSGSGFPQFGETTSDNRKDVKMSESPTPDVVQHAHEGESQDVTQIKTKEETAVDLVQMASDPVVDLPDTSVHSTLPEQSNASSTPTSLPDILKSYPLSTGKVDSGSSEESSDEHSPVKEVSSDSHLDSATDPFSFNSKALLLKEMAEETEARETAAKEQQSSETLDEKSFGAFDLVKEVETTTKTKDSPVMQSEEKSWVFSGQDSAKFDSSEVVKPLSSMNLPISSPTKPSAVEESDSESPMTDSLSPVLEAMAKNPASFQVEIESKCLEELKTSPVKGIKGVYVEEHETSEQEVSSEEFEFIERPPKGVMDEFLENLESAKFAKASEMGTDDDVSPGFGQGELAAEAVSQRSSYLLLTQPTSRGSFQKVKAELENPLEPSEFEQQAQEPASAMDVFLRPMTEEPEKPTPAQKKPEDQPTDVTACPETPNATMLQHLRTEAAVELLYWRDVKTTGVVFGASLFLLLSLTVCSIISVCSYVALALLSVTITFRIYKGILQAVQKSDEGHPFKAYLAQDVTLSEDLVHKYSDITLVHINNTMKELRRLFLVEDLVDSLKFAVLMWILTYVGALFNGLTLLILGLIAVFSVPVIYEKHQAQIDHYLALARNQIKDIFGKIQAKIPGVKPKTE